MKVQNLATNAQNTPPILESNIPKEKGRTVATLDEIHRRALEIHAERGDHPCDLDGFLDEWLRAEHELRGKYNWGEHEGAKEK